MGSVLYCGIRFAGNNYISMVTKENSTFEIVSLVGTIDYEGNPHIHISLADNEGKTIGGHLPSLLER